MDLNKRYCQNRVRKGNPKLKTLLEKDDIHSEEDGRRLKLKRFMRDVSTFVQSQDHSHSPVAKTKRSTFQSGIQTKYIKRDGCRKGVTSQLDENLFQILGVSNKENKNPCSCVHHCKSTFPVLSENPPEIESNLRLSSDSSSASSLRLLHKTSVIKSKTEKENQNWLSNYDKLDKELYPEFTRIITDAFTKRKAVHFPKKSYVNALKKRLLCLYMQGIKENSQCSKSVGTSPMDNSLPSKRPSVFTDTASESCDGPSEEGRFTLRNFVPNPTISTRQFLEENIGPAPRRVLQPNNSHAVTRHPSTVTSRPVCLYNNLYQPPSSPPLPSPPLSYSGTLANTYDFLNLHQPNWFIPPVEVDSPELKYFPRKMI